MELQESSPPHSGNKTQATKEFMYSHRHKKSFQGSYLLHYEHPNPLFIPHTLYFVNNTLIQGLVKCILFITCHGVFLYCSIATSPEYFYLRCSADMIQG